LKFLLDTHVFLWAVDDPMKLPPQVLDLLRSGQNQLLVSAASAWEITIKSGIGKHLVWQHGSALTSLDSFIERLGATPVPIQVQHATEFLRFRDCRNKDPFDRVIAAQAVIEGATLLTADRAFGDFPGLITFWS